MQPETQLKRCLVNFISLKEKFPHISETATKFILSRVEAAKLISGKIFRDINFKYNKEKSPFRKFQPKQQILR